MHKIVINGIYKTPNTHVMIAENNVTKTFLPYRDYKLRFRRESKALSRMAHLNHVPKLIRMDVENYTLTMSRLAGETPSTLSLNNVKQLRGIVHRMIESGVARHAMPIRDILVNKNDELGMVDFERVSLRRWKLSPVWLIACVVTNYHTCRLIRRYQPQCLSKNERRLFLFCHAIRVVLQPLNHFKKSIRKIVKVLKSLNLKNYFKRGVILFAGRNSFCRRHSSPYIDRRQGAGEDGTWQRRIYIPGERRH